MIGSKGVLVTANLAMASGVGGGGQAPANGGI